MRARPIESAEPQAEVSARCKEQVAHIRQHVKERFANRESGDALLRHLSSSFDALIVDLIGSRQMQLGRVAVVALGGYGRRELFPYSDIDLVILHKGAKPAQLEALVNAVVYPLWDARVNVGHTTRSIRETIDLARTDLTTRTALLDGRLIWGDVTLFEELRHAAAEKLFRVKDLDGFLDDLITSRNERHAKFGESIYRLEPNVKSGKGGLRDLCAGLWAAKVGFGVDGYEDLARVGAATERQMRALVEARRFLVNLRLAMHLEAGRPQDQLLFEMQEEIAARLLPAPAILGLAKAPTSPISPGVERLMNAYYRYARRVVLETDGIIARSRPAAKDKKKPQPIEGSFELVAKSVRAKRLDVFWEGPATMLRVFRIALKHDVGIDFHTLDAIAEAAASDPGTATYRRRGGSKPLV